MRRVKFPLVKSGNKVQYPDDIDYFSNVTIDHENLTVYADYSGNNGTIEESDEVLEITLNITVDGGSVVSKSTNQNIAYVGTFTPPLTFPDPVPLSLIDRNGNHVKNVGVNVTDGVTSGNFSFSESGDYYITSKGINYHKHLFNIDINLQEDILIRIYE